MRIGLPGALEDARAHQSAVRLQDPGRLALARPQRVDVVGHGDVEEAARVRADDLDEIAIAAGVGRLLVHEVVVRVAAGYVILVQVDVAGQIHHGAFGLFQHVEVDPGRVDRPAAAGSTRAAASP